MHDGGPSHFNILFREYLNESYPDRWIGREDPTPWLPRSPDLNLLHYFLWDFLKTSVYECRII